MANPVILRCEACDAPHRKLSLEGCTVEVATGPSSFEASATLRHLSMTVMEPNLR